MTSESKPTPGRVESIQIESAQQEMSGDELGAISGGMMRNDVTAGDEGVSGTSATTSTSSKTGTADAKSLIDQSLNTYGDAWSQILDTGRS